ncbi:hypothetical protein H0H93_014267, partial [Arthromyces matolae]
MELVAPTSFLYAFLSSPSRPPIVSAQSLLASLYLLHYVNRALLSPLRTPSRSKSHIVVPLAGITFNILNGSLLGAYLASPTASSHVANYNVSSSTSFWVGIALWALGAAGNIWHDEVLLNIRRKARAKGKARDGTNENEHYAIPQGGLYSLVSYPNYLCEWVEWAGFALAASPFPSVEYGYLSFEGLKKMIEAPAGTFAPTLTPPYIFLLNEILLMFPRALRGHQWYKTRFGPAYPPERRA